MSISFSLYNSTASAIVIDDIPVPKTIPVRGNVDLDASTTLNDVANSLLIRQYELSGQIAVILNGRQMRLSKLGIALGIPASGGGGGGVTSLNGQTGAISVPIILWDDSTPWATIVTMLTAANFKAIVYVEQKFGFFPYQEINSSIDAKNIFFLGASYDGTLPVIRVDDGVTLGSSLNSKHIDWQIFSFSPVFTGTTSIFLDKSNLYSPTSPGVLCSGGVFQLINQSRIGPGAGTVALTDGATVSFNIEEISSLDDSGGAPIVLQGGATSAGVNIVMDDSSYAPNTAFGAGIAVGRIFSSLSSAVVYDDALVTPPTIGATTVQGAIDVLKVARVTAQFVSDPTSLPNLVNSAVETSLLPGGQGTTNLPLTFFNTGVAAQIEASGFFSSKNGAPGTVQMKIKLLTSGADIVVFNGTATLPNNQTNSQWKLNCTVNAAALAADTPAPGDTTISVISNDAAEFYDSADKHFTIAPSVNTALVTGFSSTTFNVDISATFSLADAANSITLTKLNILKLDRGGGV